MVGDAQKTLAQTWDLLSLAESDISSAGLKLEQHHKEPTRPRSSHHSSTEHRDDVWELGIISGCQGALLLYQEPGCYHPVLAARNTTGAENSGAIPIPSPWTAFLHPQDVATLK